jgi:hypothetical protein
MSFIFWCEELVRSGRTAPENIKVKVGDFLFFVSNFIFRLEI